MSNIRLAVPGLSLLAAAVFLFVGSLQSARADEPIITYQYPEEGAVVEEPLDVVQICFEAPIDVRDLPSAGGEGDFRFSFEKPDGFGLGMRIVFQPDGYGVAIYPGNVEEDFEGDWTLNYRVRDLETLEPLEGAINFEVDASEGEPVLTPTPSMCPGTGEPVLSPQTIAPSDGEPTDEPDEPGLDEDDDGPDVLELALLTIGAAGGAAVIGIVGYVFRRRIGFWMHDPKDEPDSGHESEH